MNGENVVKYLVAAYPHVYKDYDENQLRFTVSIWQDAFKNLPDNVVEKAVKKAVYENKTNFPPSIGMVNFTIRRMLSHFDAEGQWEKVLWIVRNVPEGLHKAPGKYLDEVSQDIVDERYLRRLKDRVSDHDHKTFIDRYNELKEKREEEAVETGNLLLIASEEEVKQIGVQHKRIESHL